MSESTHVEKCLQTGHEEEDSLAAGHSIHVALPYTLIACLNPKGEILMLRRMKPPFVGSWNFVGGKIEENEFALISAQRELEEEAGVLANLDSIRFRGLAIWPDSQWHASLTGMFLFTVRTRIGRRDSRQMLLLDEGAVAWLPVDTLASTDLYPVVPNFSLLLPLFAGRYRIPRLLVHAKDAKGRYCSVYVRIHPSCRLIHRAVRGRTKIPLANLVESPRDLSKAIRLLDRKSI